MTNVLLSPDNTLTDSERSLLCTITDELSQLVARAQDVLWETQSRLPIVTALVDSSSVLTPTCQPELAPRITDKENMARKYHVLSTVLKQAHQVVV